MKLQPKKDSEKIVNNIIEHGVDYIRNNEIKSLIVGISGGVDSAVTAALCELIVENIRGRDISLSYIKPPQIIGVSLPYHTNKTEEINRARNFGDIWCDKLLVFPVPESYVINILNLVDEEQLVGSDFEIKVRKGNIVARTRMMILYHIAHKNHGIVMSTDNLTEYMLGFWTLHGDVGDLGLIQNLWKTEVYNIARYLNVDIEIIDAVPTAGLGITESDFDQLGCSSYEEIDAILITYLRTGDPHLEVHPIIQRYLNTGFKRNNPYNIIREDLLKEVV